MKRNWRKGTGKLVHISRLNEFKNWWLKGQISSNRSYGKEREWCGISGVLCDQNLVLFGKWAVPFATPKGTSECLKTEQEAKKLGVVGWVKNTSQGTVTGQVQGPEEKVNEMKSWLSKVGSPSSRIDKTNFSNEKEISKLDFSDFNTRY